MCEGGPQFQSRRSLRRGCESGRHPQWLLRVEAQRFPQRGARSGLSLVHDPGPSVTRGHECAGSKPTGGVTIRGDSAHCLSRTVSSHDGCSNSGPLVPASAEPPVCSLRPQAAGFVPCEWDHSAVCIQQEVSRRVGRCDRVRSARPRERPAEPASQLPVGAPVRPLTHQLRHYSGRSAVAGITCSTCERSSQLACAFSNSHLLPSAICIFRSALDWEEAREYHRDSHGGSAAAFGPQPGCGQLPPSGLRAARS